jgi:hypothetical protein
VRQVEHGVPSASPQDDKDGKNSIALLGGYVGLELAHNGTRILHVKFLSLAFFAATLLGGCSSLTGSAIRTGPLVLPPYAGAVSLYASGRAPEGQELGVVEVRGAEGESDIGTLLPLFVQKAAQIGANAVVLDSVDARFDTFNMPQMETYAVPCGFRGTCYRSRTFMSTSEVMTVVLHGRAFRTEGSPQ